MRSLKKIVPKPEYWKNAHPIPVISIMAGISASDNPADAYSYYYQHSPAAFTPGMMGKAVQTAQIKGYAAKKQLRKRSVRRTKWKMRKAIRRSKKRLKAKMKAKAKNMMLKPVRSLKSKYKRLPLEKRMLVNLGGRTHRRIIIMRTMRTHDDMFA